MDRRKSSPTFPHAALASRSVRKSRANAKPRRIFLLSPANPAGVRGKWLTSGRTDRGMSCRLRNSGIPLGELFTFISGLYFRGKLAYAQAFGRGSSRIPGAFVITSCLGLLPPEEVISLAQLRAICEVPVHPDEPRYRLPLERDARALLRRMGERCEVVLLGSIATAKYVEPLSAIFGQRLLFPAEFVGRGDMSRGGLMLRCVQAGLELNYQSLSGRSVRHGARPPRLSEIFGER